MNRKFFMKILTIIPIIICGILFFLIGISSVQAAACEENAKQSYFLSALNPLLSFAENTVKGFGYNIALAASPDPDFCGSDSVGCSGITPTATVSWTEAPGSLDYGMEVIFCYISYYKLTLGGNTYQTIFLNTSYVF